MNRTISFRLFVVVFFLGVLPAFADPHDGTGTMTVSPAFAPAGSTGNSFTFSFREGSPGNFPDNSTVTVAVPAGWTAPQVNNASSAGYVSAVAVGSGEVVHSTSVSGSGPWTITVSFKGHTTTNGFNLSYAGGGNKVTAPATAGMNTFTAKSQGGVSGTLTAIGTSPTIAVKPGAAATLAVSGYPNPQTAGQAGTLTVAARDQFGNTVTNYTGTVHFTSSDVQAVLPTNFTFTAANAGVHVFTNTTTLKTAGTQSITATDINTNAVTGTQSGIVVKAGSAIKLAFTTQPAGAVYKTVFATQPVVKAQDTYGNNTTNGLPANLAVTLALTTGTGPLAGTTNLNIGMTGGKGVVTFSNLQVNKAENGDVLTAITLFGLIRTASSAFNVSPAALTVSATGVNKTYDGTTSTTVTLSDNRMAGDSLTDSYTTAGFANKNVGNNKTVNVSGISISGTDAGNYSFNTTAATTANITTRSLAVSATGQNKAYNGNSDATVTLSDDRISGDTLSENYTSASFVDKNVGTGKAVSVAGISVGGADAGNYALSSTITSATANITARSLTVSATGVNRAYDGTTSETVTLSDDRINGDDLAENYTAAVFADKNVGTNKTVAVNGISITGTDAGDYNLLATTASAIANISSISVTGSIAVTNKIYDGTIAAGIATHNLTGVIGSDDVALSGGTATFDNKNVGTNKTVTATGLALSGTDAGNYSLASTTATTAADISSATLTVSATGTDKIYNGLMDATVSLSDNRISGDSFTENYAGASFADKNVGTDKNISVSGISLSGTDAGNYAFNTTVSATANITPAPLTVTAAGVNKAYDGNTTATATLSDNRIDGDTLSANYISANFSDKNVGTNKAVNVSGISLTGPDADNYSFNTTATTAADITAAAISGNITADDKVYDGTAGATIASRSLTGTVGGDDVALNGGTAAFDDKNVGTNKTVTATGLALSGTDAGNYSLASSTATATANISSAALSITATGINKVYDGSSDATVNLSDDRIGGDSLNTSYAAAAFADKNVGTNKTVTVSGIALNGTDADNYHFNPTTSTTADISSRALNITATGIDKAYDGSTSTTVNLSDDRISGDSLVENYSTAGFADKNVGTAKTVSVSGIAVSGTDAGNYQLASTTTTTIADILKRTLTVSAAGINKAYDGSITATVNLSDDRLSGDVLDDSYTAAAFADKNAGTGKTISVTGISISGTDAGNYNFNTTATASADITTALVTVTANDTNRVYGAANPDFTATYSGFIAGEDAGVLDGAPAFLTTADVSSTVAGGPYPIAVTNGTLNASNYSFTFVYGELTITPAATTNTVSVSANPTATGSNVTLIATLDAIAPSAGIPTGTVQFLVDGSAFGSPATLNSGIASLDTASLTHGYHLVTAVYAGDGNCFGSTNNLPSNLLINASPAAGTYALNTTKNVAKNFSAADLVAAGIDPDNDALSVTAVNPASAQGGTVSLSGGTITYTPATDYAGPDSFTYTLADTYGAGTTGTVTVTVAPRGIQPVNFRLTIQPDGTPRIEFTGTIGANYLVEAATNLAAPSWDIIFTNVPGTNGSGIYLDTAAHNYPNRFYRVLAP